MHADEDDVADDINNADTKVITIPQLLYFEKKKTAMLKMLRFSTCCTYKVPASWSCSKCVLLFKCLDAKQPKSLVELFNWMVFIFIHMAMTCVKVLGIGIWEKQ